MEEEEIALMKKHYAGDWWADNKFLMSKYIRLVDEIGKYVEKGKILDWGSGTGELSLLLKNRGYDVLAFDILKKSAAYEKIGVEYFKGGDKLPFQNKAFDAVVSCGVLEHVPNRPLLPFRASQGPQTGADLHLLPSEQIFHIGVCGASHPFPHAQQAQHSRPSLYREGAEGQIGRTRIRGALLQAFTYVPAPPQEGRPGFPHASVQYVL